MASEIFVGSVSVGVVPDARGWNTDLRRQLIPSADAVGREYGQKLGKNITDEMGRAGNKSGGAFGDNFRKRVDAAIKAIPKVELDGDSSKIDRKLQELRAKLVEISKMDIIDAKKAMSELGTIESELAKVARKADGIDVRFNTKEARAQLDLLKRDIDKATSSGKPGIISRTLGGIGNITPGLAGTGGAGAQGAGGGGLAALAPASALANPYTIGAALAALPFIAQAASGGIVFALGGALAGMGLIGAGMDKSFSDTTKKIQRQTVVMANGQKKVIAAHTVTIAGYFTKFKNSVEKDLREIGTPFIPVLHNILNTTMQVLKTMTPLFKAVMGAIAGPFQLFVDTILKSFTRPEVQKSIVAVSDAFISVLKAFTPDIPGIFDSFAQAIERIAGAVAKNPKAFADFLNFLFQIVIFAIDAIAWLTNLATYIETHFLPAIHHIAVIFDGVRHEIAHIWDQIFENSVGMLIRLGHNVETQFNSIRHEIAVIFDGIRHDIAHVWDQIYSNTIGAVIRVWQKTNTPFANMRHDIAGHFDGIRHDIAHYWNLIFQDTIGRVIRLAHNVEALIDGLRHSIAGIYSNIRHDISSIWDTIWRNTIGRAIRGWHDLMTVFSHIKNDVTGFFSGAINWLANAGKDVIGGLLNGIKNAMGSIGSWIKNNVVDPVVNTVKHFFGISSPSTVMAGMGRNIIQGLIHGLLTSGKDLTHFITNIFGGLPAALGALVNKSLVAISKLPSKALRALSGLGGFFEKLFGGGPGGSGVERWLSLVKVALMLNNLSDSLAGQVLFQMRTESGGNPNAINLTDINAQRGDPSRGLMQTIGSTFAAYHIPGTSNNIYDPLANIAAAINYAKHVYGPTLMRGGMGMGSGHGYAEGGPILEPIVGVGLGSGSFYTFGERGREWVTPGGRPRGGDGAVAYHAHFDGLTGAAIESHVQTAFTVMSLTQGALSRNGRRSLWHGLILLLRSRLTTLIPTGITGISLTCL